MKYIQQFMVILWISFLGEVLHFLLPFPVPASIYGLLLMLAGLLTGIVRLQMVDDTARLLIEIMPLMFIPSLVGLMDSWKMMESILIPVAAISVVSTILVMGVSGSVAQWIMKRRRKA